MNPTKAPAEPDKETDPEAYETRHVHDVYNEIAAHFSSTRYKVRHTCSPSENG